MQKDAPTSIEVETCAALAELGITFYPQHRLGRFVVDAFLPDTNTVIECQGDFWHCNPAVYADGPTCMIQRKTVGTDKYRFEKLTAEGYAVIALWEKDIRTFGAKALLERALAPTPQP